MNCLFVPVLPIALCLDKNHEQGHNKNTNIYQPLVQQNLEELRNFDEIRAHDSEKTTI